MAVAVGRRMRFIGREEKEKKKEKGASGGAILNGKRRTYQKMPPLSPPHLALAPLKSKAESPPPKALDSGFTTRAESAASSVHPQGRRRDPPFLHTSSLSAVRRRGGGRLRVLNGIFMLTETTVRFLPFPTLDPLPSPRGMDTVCLGG